MDKRLELTSEAPSSSETGAPIKKNGFSGQIMYKIELIKTSFLEMLELQNFGDMTTSTIYFESRDKTLLVTSWKKIIASELLIQNTFFLRRPRHLPEILQINLEILCFF